MWITYLFFLLFVSIFTCFEGFSLFSGGFILFWMLVACMVCTLNFLTARQPIRLILPHFIGFRTRENNFFFIVLQSFSHFLSFYCIKKFRILLRDSNANVFSLPLHSFDNVLFHNLWSSEFHFHRRPFIATGLGWRVLSYVYTLRLIGPISYPGECDLMFHPQKVQRHFPTIAFCWLCTYITCTKIRKSARLIAVCKRSFRNEDLCKWRSYS